MTAENTETLTAILILSTTHGEYVYERTYARKSAVVYLGSRQGDPEMTCELYQALLTRIHLQRSHLPG
jgi:hypothetical protein